MDGTVASQLQAIKSQLRGPATDTTFRTSRPITRPSVLFDPKQAADIDVRTILPIALSGLDVLVGLDSRFERYKSSIFSAASLDVDREKMVPIEEKKIHKSVTFYLRLLSGHLQLPAALKTLEYLIRRYLIHVYNVDELVLCALPYHDTHAFVRIMQLIDLKNNIWGFLEGSKVSGAPPPRRVIVQQCIRDKGLLEALCNHASPTNEFCHSRPVICFCTAVVVEALGSVQKLDDETVKRVLPFVFNGLNPAMKGTRDAKAGALMVVGLIASRASLASKLVQNLIFFIARVAHQDAKESADLAWLRVALMAIITIVQSQTVNTLFEKSLKILVDIRDISGILAGLSQDFNIEKFLSLYLQTLVDYSSSDIYRSALITSLEIIPVKEFISALVPKLLSSCLKWSQDMEENLHEAGGWVKKIFVVLDKSYKSELRVAMKLFFENSQQYSMEEERISRTLGLIFDGRLDMTFETSDSKFWFSLQHPKAQVRQITLSHLSSSGLLKAKPLDPLFLSVVQDTIIRQLFDDDLAVVQAALSMEELSGLLDSAALLRAIQDVLSRCIVILKTGAKHAKAACEVAVLCLRTASQLNHTKEMATMLFPLLLIFPKTWRVNLMAIELAKATQWTFYCDSFSSVNISLVESSKVLENDSINTLNLKTVEVLAESFTQKPGDYIEWLIECSKSFDPSKSLFLLVMLQSISGYKGDVSGLLRLSDVCFPVFKNELDDVALKRNIILSEELIAEKLDNSLLGCVNMLLQSNVELLNVKIIVCICWAFLEVFASKSADNAQADNCKQLYIFDNLFIFFTSSSLKDVFKEHILFLLTKCDVSPVEFLSRFFTVEGIPVAVQVESLGYFASLCYTMALADTNTMHTNKALEFLIGFPSVLVPLSHKTKDVRAAAMSCIDALYNLWTHFDGSRVRNGNDMLLIQYVSTPIFGDLLTLINEQKKLILSDVKFLPSLLASTLGKVPDTLLLPQNIDKRFDQQAKDTILVVILNSVLKLSSYAKLMVLLLFEGIGNSILQLVEVQLLLSGLMERRSHHLRGISQKSFNNLSETETEILCTLLKMSVVAKDSANVGSSGFHYIIKAIKVDGLSLDDMAVVEPCVTALESISSAWYNSLGSEKQDELFGNLVTLFQNNNGRIRSAAKEALLRINVNYSSVVKLLEAILAKVHESGSLSASFKKKKLHGHRNIVLGDLVNRGEMNLSAINSLLDILLMKKDIQSRMLFVEPLFQLLRELFSDKWFQMLTGMVEEGTAASLKNLQTVADAITDAQQTTLAVLEDISTSLIADVSFKDGIFNEENVKLLVECARSTENAVTCNHIFLLLAAIAKNSPGYVSECIPDILSVIGEAIVKQNDSRSQHVLEDLISTLVPCWLSKIDGVNNLLQVFTNILPHLLEHRRLTLMVYLLRTLGEKGSLGTFLALLFRSLALRKTRSDYEGALRVMSLSSICREWEYLFAEEISCQFPCMTWLPCLIVLLEEAGSEDLQEIHYYEMLVVFHFITQKLQDTELIYELESGQHISYLQCILGTLMEKVVLQRLCDKTRFVLSIACKKQLKEIEFCLMKMTTKIMLPSEYYKCIRRLLDNADINVRKKTLRLLCNTVKNNKSIARKHKQMNKKNFHMDDGMEETFQDMCLKLIQFVGDSSTTVALSAVSCLEDLVNEFPFYDNIFMASLKAIVKRIASDDLHISSCCLQCLGALINILGSKALPELPNIMKSILGSAHDFSIRPCRKRKDSHFSSLNSNSSCNTLLSLSMLMTLEAIVEHLGCFLNPYLEDIFKILILRCQYASESDPRIKSKAAVVRKLVIEKIPVRLILTPLLKIYSEAVEADEPSVILYFEMLTDAIDSMDRSSIGSYHKRIFEKCLLALDLRRQPKKSVSRINVVEQNVIHAIVVLTMKLTESMFRPIFLLSLEWAESDELVADSLMMGRSIERAIAFYNLVNKLTEQHRSLFVPYFKYLIDSCTHCLTDYQQKNLSSLTQKRKKAKIGEEHESEEKGSLKTKQWHLKALILASLYKCFLYDTGNSKFLDSSNFQILLKPIVSQLVAEPPVMQEDLLDVPAIEEVDESLVSCLGQMAVAVGSDDIWKQLNHEVLMQTRSEKIRPRILGLKVVKYLMEHLKEEYLILLPETIPFLGELLEDVELPVKSLAQEVFKGLESLSGESLRQYL